ncbi:MAG: IS200/IS605 family transposase [Planctomycetes bacterium]|nr:IS200/IS605 family transposase [Planctomycetota bacterium]
MGQSLASLLVHIVFSTKNRQPLITPDLEPELHAYLGGVCKELHSPALAINGYTDHVHLLCSLSKTMALAELLRKVKAHSSTWAKRKGRAHGNFAWQDGYSAFSIGQSGVPALMRYIESQKNRHRRVGYQEELRSFFKKYGVAFDERYVWA